MKLKFSNQLPFRSKTSEDYLAAVLQIVQYLELIPK